MRKRAIHVPYLQNSLNISLVPVVPAPALRSRAGAVSMWGALVLEVAGEVGVGGERLPRHLESAGRMRANTWPLLPPRAVAAVWVITGTSFLRSLLPSTPASWVITSTSTEHTARAPAGAGG